MSRPQVALSWLAGCGGCEESLLDLGEKLFELADELEIVFWPIALDFRLKDLEALGDGQLAASLLNGSVTNQEQLELARLLRRKSRLLIAHGSCAHLGGVPGLANLHGRRAVLERTFRESSIVHNPAGVLPGGPGTAQAQDSSLLPQVMALDQVVAVDYYLPGCPPTPELMARCLEMLVQGALPAQGSVLAEDRALCHSCPLNGSRPQRLRLKGFQRLAHTQPQPDSCYLAQGLICLGPATRGGCRARCIQANMPCRGCFGPTSQVADQGAKALSLLAGLLESADPVELEDVAGSLGDLAGLLYRYSLPVSILGRGEEG